MSKKIISKACSAQILGKPKIKKDTSPTTTLLCVNCDKEIPAERIVALKSLDTPATKWTHKDCSTVTKIKGLYLGEAGTSTLQLCDKLYDDSVRSVFRGNSPEEDSEDS